MLLDLAPTRLALLATLPLRQRYRTWQSLAANSISYLPWKGSIGGLSAAVLRAKNADAKRRLCAEQSEGGRMG
jgi:hypothetical protein